MSGTRSNLMLRPRYIHVSTDMVEFAKVAESNVEGRKSTKGSMRGTLPSHKVEVIKRLMARENFHIELSNFPRQSQIRSKS